MTDSEYITEVAFNLMDRRFKEDIYDKLINAYSKSEDHELLKKVKSVRKM